MKKYYSNVSIIFVFVLVVIFLSSTFIYTDTADKTSEKMATETVTEVSRQVALAIDLRLESDYDDFVAFVTTHQTLAELNANKDDLKPSGVAIVEFAEIKDDGITTGGTIYPATEAFKATGYYDQSVAVYRLSDAFTGIEDDTEYCIFKSGDIVAYFSADEYFTPFFTRGDDPENTAMIASASGYIGYRENLEGLGKQLFTEVLNQAPASALEQMQTDLAAKKAGQIRTNVAGKAVFLAYRPLTTGDIVVIQSFPKTGLYKSASFIFLPALYMVAVSTACFLIYVVLVFFYLNKKNTDIEFSKRRYYYNKPFIIKITRKGRITGFNRTCRENIRDWKEIRTVLDFKLARTSADLMLDIKKQDPFTVQYLSTTGTLEYLRLIPVRSTSGYYLLGENITNQQKDFEYHRNMALYNPSTQLPNKNYLSIKLDNLFANEEALSQRNVIVAIELTSFKNIQRLFGKKTGEATLAKVTETIKSMLTGFEAILYHVDVGTFVALLLNLAKYQDAIDWSERLAALFEKPIDVAGNLFNIEVKVGVFEIDPSRYSTLTSYDAYDNVLLALKRAKESRRTNVVVYDLGMGQVFTRTQAMETDLVSALKNKEFKVSYQPQLNTTNNQIVAVESLLRWDNPKYALDSPALFIELAEQNNLIVEIGRFIINETFQTAKEFEKYNVKVAINISPVQILQSGFVYDMTSAFDRFRLKKDSVIIEITETMLMESFDSIVDKLFTLKKHGFQIHLDNFGTGYSSMLYLKDLPIDGISISREFIKGLENDRHARAIVSKIISLANSLEIEVVAEGVETEKQKSFLNQNGCFIIQGFLISRVVTKQEVVKLIEQYNANSEKKIEDIIDDDYDFLR